VTERPEAARVERQVAAVVADVGEEARALDVATWLAELERAARAAERPGRAARAALVKDGARAAAAGSALAVVIDAWLTSGWVLWRTLEAEDVSRAELGRLAGALLRALDDGAKELAAGYVNEQRAAVRRDEGARAVLLDDLLGAAPVDEVVAAADALGIDVRAARAVLVARGSGDALLDRLRDAGALATPRGGLLVAVLAGAEPPRVGARAGLGRPAAGVAGIRRSYREARRALDVADRLGLVGVVPYDEVLPEVLLAQDPAALAVLVDETLAGLRGGRRGAAPLLETLDAWFACNRNVAATARRLGIHERTAVYRLQRVEALTGLDLDDADDAFRLQLALRGRTLITPETP